MTTKFKHTGNYRGDFNLELDVYKKAGIILTLNNKKEQVGYIVLSDKDRKRLIVELQKGDKKHL